MKTPARDDSLESEIEEGVIAVSYTHLIYPFIKNAFETCKKNGYMDGSHFNDLAISSMNVGWEVPGTFDCGILFECPSLTAVM